MWDSFTAFPWSGCKRLAFCWWRCSFANDQDCNNSTEEVHGVTGGAECFLRQCSSPPCLQKCESFTLAQTICWAPTRILPCLCLLAQALLTFCFPFTSLAAKRDLKHFPIYFCFCFRNSSSSPLVGNCPITNCDGFSSWKPFIEGKAYFL